MRLMNAGIGEIIAKSIVLHINSWIDDFKNR